MKIFKVIILTSIAIFAFLNGLQEGHLMSGFIGMVLAIIGPFMFIRFTSDREKKSNFHYFSNAGMATLNLLVLLAYALYYFGGASNPDTAGHMHIILFPALVIFFGTFVMHFFTFIDQEREKASNQVDENKKQQLGLTPRNIVILSIAILFLIGAIQYGTTGYQNELAEKRKRLNAMNLQEVAAVMRRVELGSCFLPVSQFMVIYLLLCADFNTAVDRAYYYSYTELDKMMEYYKNYGTKWELKWELSKF